MSDAAHNLALETSGRAGSVVLGRGDELLEVVDLPEPKRHTLGLMPAVASVCARHGVTPAKLAEVYVSAGPGSFTGLRVGIATAKMLAEVLGARLVAVPTLEALAQNAGDLADADTTLAVALAVKRETLYAGLFARRASRWTARGEPGLRTWPALLAEAGRPLAILADVLPDGADAALADAPGVRRLPRELAAPRGEAVWRLGRDRARRGDFTDPLALLPLYARPPEAEELWKQRLAAKSPESKVSSPKSKTTASTIR